MKLLIKDVLLEKERKKLLKDCKPFLYDKGPATPGLQSDFVQKYGSGYAQFQDVHHKFLDIYDNEEDYAYLEKIFDSNENNSKFKVKIFKIDFIKFDS